jgi:hypothetical protein
MKRLRNKLNRAAVRIYCGDFGVNQSAEVGGLVGAAIAITAGIAAKGTEIGGAVATFFTNHLT